MGSNVSRRSFIRIATDSLITIPAAAAALATAPAQTLAAESKPEEGVWGVRGPVAEDGVLWTNEITLIPLVASEVAFHVCDMSIRNPRRTSCLAPIGHKPGFSAKLSKIIPIGGGDTLKSWLPTFGPFEVSFDPGGSASVALIIAQNEWNGWGESKEWKTRPDGTMAETSSSHGAKPTSKDGWQWFPQKSIDDQWEKKKQDIVNGYKAYKAAKGDRKDIYYSKGFKMSVKLIAKGTVSWEGLKYTGKSLFETRPGDLAWNAKNSARFSGALGFMIVANAGYEFCRNFFWGPVPMLFQFGINLTLTASALCGIVVDDPDKDRLDKVKRGEPVTDIWNVVTNLDNWNFDFTNTGFGLTVLFSPYISLGVGVKGVASASVRGAVMLTIYLGIPSRRTAMHDGQPDISDETAYPSPHWIFSYQAEITVQLKLFFFSYSISACKGKKDNAYNNWPCKENNFKPGGGWAEGNFLEAAAEEDVYFDSYAHRDLASVLDELMPMDPYFSQMVEGRRVSDGLSAQAEDEQPVGYSNRYRRCHRGGGRHADSLCGVQRLSARRVRGRRSDAKGQGAHGAG